MKAYHFTSVNNLESISKKGLVPGNGDNSKLIDDQKEKVFFQKVLRELLLYMLILIWYLKI